MAETDLERFGALIKQEQTTLLARWRLQARELPSAKGLDGPALNDHIPVLLDELALALESPADRTIAQVVTDGQARAHGLQRLQDDFQRSRKSLRNTTSCATVSTNWRTRTV